VIFPEQCKYVGFASEKPCGEKVYFLSRFLIRRAGDGYEIVEVTLDPEEKGMMRSIVASEVIARPDEVCRYPEKVQLNDRAKLARLATGTGKRCTIFTGLDEHLTFVLDPDFSEFLMIHVYDVSPPLPSLSAAIRNLEAAGLFGELSVTFHHHITDIAGMKADVYPCRAAGFAKTLDADRLSGGERIAACLTGSQLAGECYGTEFTLENICPLSAVEKEPFIARCCRAEREGFGTWNGKRGTVVHWGASPARIAGAITDLAARWRAQ
jgi:hypothetical protein